MAMTPKERNQTKKKRGLTEKYKMSSYLFSPFSYLLSDAPEFLYKKICIILSKLQFVTVSQNVFMSFYLVNLREYTEA